MLVCVPLLLGPTVSCSSSSECSAGAARCDCYPNGTCDTGLTCASGLCVALSGDSSNGSGDAAGGDPGPTGICASGFDSGNDSLNTCLTSDCCGPFDDCFDDVACRACIEGGGTDCGSNALYLAFGTCADASCPANICGSAIAYIPDGIYDFDCHACLNLNCCTEIDDCMGGDAAAASGTQVNDCLACLGAPAEMPCTGLDAGVQNGAAMFQTCKTTECGTVCPAG